MHLRIASRFIPFWLEEDDTTPQGIHGYLTDVLDFMMYKLNATYELDFSGETYYGNETDDGIVGKLYRNESDISLNLFSRISPFKSFLDFHNPICEQDWALISGPPRAFVENHYAILSILEPSVWLCALISIISFCCVIYTLTWFLARPDIKAGFLYILLLLICSLFRGYPPKLSTDAYRIMWGFWLLGTFSLLSSFTGCLLSKLTLPDRPSRIEVFADLLPYPELRVVVIRDTIVYYHLKDATDPVLKEVYNQAVRTEGIIGIGPEENAEVAFQAAEGKTVAIFWANAFFEGLQDYKICGNPSGGEGSFYMSTTPFLHDQGWMVTKKDSPRIIKNLYKFIASVYTESGITNHKIDMATFWSKMCFVFANTAVEAKEEPLIYKNLHFGFAFGTLGLVVSVTCLTFEITRLLVLNRRNYNKRRHRLRRLAVVGKILNNKRRH